MFIQPGGLFTYFPDESEESLKLKIIQAQSLIESYLGANRSLEIKEYVEILPVRSTSNCLLKFLPLINDAVNYPIDLKLRTNSQEWINIDSEKYEIDFELGEIVFKDLSLVDRWSSVYDAPRSFNYYNRARQPRGKFYSQIRINYFSGFDFSTITPGSLTENVLLQFINLIRFQSDDKNSGIKRFSLEEHYEVEYQVDSARSSAKDSKGQGSPINDLLAYFKQFKPRQFNN